MRRNKKGSFFLIGDVHTYKTTYERPRNSINKKSFNNKNPITNFKLHQQENKS